MNTTIIFIGFCVIISSQGILQAYELKEAAKTQAGREKATVMIQRNGKVYLLSEHNPGPDGLRTGYYKIGKTTQVVNRHISDLQGGNPHHISHFESHPVPDMNENSFLLTSKTCHWKITYLQLHYNIATKPKSIIMCIHITFQHENNGSAKWE